MALSDCPKCWETPCACGHEYRDWSIERLEDQIATLTLIMIKKKEERDARHRGT